MAEYTSLWQATLKTGVWTVYLDLAECNLPPRKFKTIPDLAEICGIFWPALLISHHAVRAARFHGERTSTFRLLAALRVHLVVARLWSTDRIIIPAASPSPFDSSFESLLPRPCLARRELR
jgi:hypothetical protein